MGAHITERENVLEHDIRTLCAVQLALNRVEQRVKCRILRTQDRERMPLGQRVDVVGIHRCRLCVNLVMRERPHRRLARHAVKERRMHIAETLHLTDRHALLDEGLLRRHDLLCVNVTELLHEVLADGVEILAARQAFDEVPNTPLPRLCIITDDLISMLLKRRDDLRELDPLHRRAARNCHDTPHHVQRNGICNLLKADPRHDLTDFWILLHQLGNRLFQIEYLFHGFSPLSILSYIIISM